MNLICLRGEELDFKYTLIISQYYHTYYSFLVKFDAATFKEKAKDFIAELEQYKRPAGYGRDIQFGDITYRDTPEIYSRYNVNDCGDIYFINSPYANYCMKEAARYNEESLRASRGYKRNVITEQIYEHHSYEVVKKIVEKYFEIA